MRAPNAPDVKTPPLDKPTAEQEALRLARSGVHWQIISVAVSVILGIVALTISLLEISPVSQPEISTQVGPASTELATISASNSTQLPSDTRLDELQTAQAQPIDSFGSQAVLNLTATASAVNSYISTRVFTEMTATQIVLQNSQLPTTLIASTNVADDVTSSTRIANSTPFATLIATSTLMVNASPISVQSLPTRVLTFPCSGVIVNRTRVSQLNIVYVRPSDTLSPSSYIQSGATVNILENAILSGRTWYRIDYGQQDRRSGWVWDTYVELGDDCPYG